MTQDDSRRAGQGARAFFAGNDGGLPFDSEAFQDLKRAFAERFCARAHLASRHLSKVAEQFAIERIGSEVAIRFGAASAEIYFEPAEFDEELRDISSLADTLAEQFAASYNFNRAQGNTSSWD